MKTNELKLNIFSCSFTCIDSITICLQIQNLQYNKGDFLLSIIFFDSLIVLGQNYISVIEDKTRFGSYSCSFNQSF